MALFALSNILVGFLAFAVITGPGQIGKQDEPSGQISVPSLTSSIALDRSGLTPQTSASPASTITLFNTTTETKYSTKYSTEHITSTSTVYTDKAWWTLPRTTTTETIYLNNTDAKIPGHYSTVTETETVPTTHYEGIMRTTTATKTTTATEITTATMTETKPITHYTGVTDTITSIDKTTFTEYSAGTATVHHTETATIAPHARNSIKEALGSNLWQVLTWIFTAIVLGVGYFFGRQWIQCRAWYLQNVQHHVDQSRQERDAAIAARDEATERADIIEREYQGKEDKQRERFGKIETVVQNLFGKIPAEQLDHPNWEHNVQAHLDIKATQLIEGRQEEKTNRDF